MHGASSSVGMATMVEQILRAVAARLKARAAARRLPVPGLDPVILAVRQREAARLRQVALQVEAEASRLETAAAELILAAIPGQEILLLPGTPAMAKA
jgi:hypothetical protein